MTYVSLLRGINAGRIIKMDELKACFEAMGFASVKTVLQTGNVLFASDENPSKLQSKIEAGLAKSFNYPAKIWVLSAEELGHIIANNPFDDASTDYHQYVIFFENDLASDFAAETVDTEDETVQAGPGIVYWKVQKGQTLKSPRGKLLGKTKYRGLSTTRNMNTVQKLYGLMQ